MISTLRHEMSGCPQAQADLLPEKARCQNESHDKPNISHVHNSAPVDLKLCADAALQSRDVKMPAVCVPRRNSTCWDAIARQGAIMAAGSMRTTRAA